MPPRRRTAAPPIDVDDLRARLDEGKIVRVAIAHSAQFPPDSVGRVRRIGDPDVDGEEYIHVELTVNGTKDLLPFAPADLTPPSKGSGTNGGPVPVERPSSGALKGTPGTEPVTGPSPATPEPVESPPRPKPTRAKPAAKRRGPSVAISIGSTEADPPQWRIEAKVGSKVVLRNGSVPPARVWELVGRLGDESLTRAVGTVLDEQRQAAQSRADALAAELEKVRAELAQLPAPSNE